MNIIKKLVNRFIESTTDSDSAEAQLELRWTTCERKERYDLRGARTVINAFAKQRGRHGRPQALRAYACPFCSGWHLTKARHEVSRITFEENP